MYEGEDDDEEREEDEGEDDDEECEEDDHRGTLIGDVMKCGIKELRKRNPMTLDDAGIVISNLGLSVDEVEESLADDDAEGYALGLMAALCPLRRFLLEVDRALAGFRPGGAANAKKKAVRRIVDLRMAIAGLQSRATAADEEARRLFML